MVRTNYVRLDLVTCLNDSYDHIPYDFANRRMPNFRPSTSSTHLKDWGATSYWIHVHHQISPVRRKTKTKAISDPSTYESPGRRKRQFLMFKQKKRIDAFVETEHLLKERTNPIFFHLKWTRTHEMKNEEYTLFFCVRSRRRQETRLLHSPRNKSVKLTTSKHKHNFWFWSLL